MNSTTSRRREGTPFSRHSLCPSRYSRRGTTISVGATAPQATPPAVTSLCKAVPSNVSETSANPAGPRDSDPAKMTSSMARPRRCLADCSPMTQRMASTMFDLPQPFGPTMPVIGSWKVTVDLSTNDLNPRISTRLILIVPPGSWGIRFRPAYRLCELFGGVTIRDIYGHAGRPNYTSPVDAV